MNQVDFSDEGDHVARSCIKYFSFLGYRPHLRGDLWRINQLKWILAGNLWGVEV